MSLVSRQVAIPFLVALAGVLVVIGLAINLVAGAVGAAAYVVLLAVPVVVLLAKARRRSARRAAGHTCTCCTGTVHDPVQVI